VLTIGEALSEARKKKDVSLKDAEKEIKIRAKYLEALEQNKFELIPGDAYVKIFIREYAHFLNIDPDTLVLEYREKYESRPQYENLAPINLNEPRRPYAKILFSSFLIILFVAGGFFVWRISAIDGRAEKALIKKDKQPAKTESGKESIEEGDAPRSKELEQVNVAPAEAPKELTVKVKIVGEEGSWIKSEVDGERVFEGTVAPGQVKEWSGKEKIVLIVGNPSGVRIEKNGIKINDMGDATEPVTKVFTP